MLHILAVTLASLALAAPAPITIDGDLADWNTIPAAPGTPAAAPQDPVSIAAAHDADWLFLRFNFLGEIDFAENNQLRIYIDTDDNPSTGLAIEGIGAEIEFRCGNRNGIRHAGGQQTPFSHSSVLFRSGPTVDSFGFENAIARSALLNAGGPVRILIRNNTTGVRAPANAAGLLYVFAGDPPPPPAPMQLERAPGSVLRVATYNVLNDRPWDFGQEPRFGRQFAAVDADVWCFQEIADHSPAETAALVGRWVSPGPGGVWHSAGNSDCKVVSRFPVLGAWPLDGNVAVLLDTTALLGKPSLVFSAHPPCCTNETARQREIDRMMGFLRDAQTPGVGPLDLPFGATVILAGDMNLVGRAQQLRTLLTGDIINTGLYGADFSPDWHGGPLNSVLPRHNADRMGYTWRDDPSAFWPGQLDYLVYSPGALELVSAFVLETATTPAAALAAAGLFADDSFAADHRLFIADFAPPACPADLNGDGAVNAADLAGLLGAWSAARAPEDINLSGAVDAADLAALLGAWGPCN